MVFSAASLRDQLTALTPSAATGLCVALSGGADSAALLAALTAPELKAFRGLPLRALHVDHGLQAAAGAFRAACIESCRRFDVPLEIISVKVARDDGGSLEAAAREARYDGIATQLAAGECVLTAHHAADQAETVLLQLLRGAGLPGLSAMPACRPLGLGWHLRPLLDVAQPELRRFAAQAGVVVVTDPMNLDPRHDRVYLRQTLWPLLEARWPGASVALSRSARHAAEAQVLLDDVAAQSLRTLRDGEGLSVTRLRALPPGEQVNAVRHWIDARSVSPPPAARLAEALRQMLHAHGDHLPAVVWDGHALRRYRERLFLTSASPPRIGEPREWRYGREPVLALGAGLGRLLWSPCSGGLDPGRLPPTLAVRRRRGGESLRPHRRARTQSVQHLCQSLGVLPWIRDALPLLYAGDDLVAVGDLWQDARWCVAAGESGARCEWLESPLLT
jgi:tRNA(Ile)-lysidine synthase